MKSIVLLQGESAESFTQIILNPYWTNDQGELTGGWMVEDNCELRIVGDRITLGGSESHDMPEFFHYEQVYHTEDDTPDEIKAAAIRACEWRFAPLDNYVKIASRIMDDPSFSNEEISDLLKASQIVNKRLSGMKARNKLKDKLANRNYE